MDEDKKCNCWEKHQSHLCVLRSKGKIKEIKRETCSLNVACLVCGEEANSENHVCVPIPLFV